MHYTYSILQLVFSLLAAFLLWGGALLLLGMGLISGLGLGGLGKSAPVGSAVGGVGFFLIAGSCAACGLLVLPSAYYAWRRVSGRQAAGRARTIQRPGLLILALPLVILAGYYVTRSTDLAWLLLPPLHLLAVGLPVAWIACLAMRELPVGSRQRAWGVFGSGLTLGPGLVMVFEVVALGVFAGLAFVMIASQPDLLEQLSALASQLSGGQLDMDGLLRLLAPWLTRPGVIYAAIVFAAVVVPLIEEAIKPIGVWLLAGFNLSPAAGFTAGALSGAAYALFESLLLSSSGEEWAAVVAARMGTGVIHILNTALMGWALASVWREKRYTRLGLTYLGVVLVHGLWNSLSVFNAIGEALKLAGMPPTGGMVGWIGPAAPYMLGGITAAAFAALLWTNQRLRRGERQEGEGIPALGGAAVGEDEAPGMGQ